MRKQHELEIKEQLNEEARIEFTYKQKELNQRINSQMMYPLNCLEKEGKLAERIRLNRNSSALSLVDDSVWQAFMSGEESKSWL